MTDIRIKPTELTPSIRSAVKMRVERFRDDLEKTVESWLEENRKEEFTDSHFEDQILSSIDYYGVE